MHFKTIDDFDFTDKTALVRVDYNVPIKDGVIQDDTRIRATLPTLKDLKERGAKIILLSHLGRPKGKPNAELSLSPIADHLSTLLDQKVTFFHDRAPSLQAGDIALRENLRFNEGEEQNAPEFARELSTLGDVFVQDAFGTAHRAHASTVGIARFLPAIAGRLMAQEMSALQTILEKPEKPVCAVIGGAKIAGKLELLENMILKVDYLVLGGGMANTFLHALGYDMKASLYEAEMKDTCLGILDKASMSGCKIIMPRDLVTTKKFEAGAPSQVQDIEHLESGDMGIDVGPDSIQYIKSVIEQCRSLIWNGPLGAFEIEPFDKGTNEVASFVAQQTKNGPLKSIAGGGDTVSALKKSDSLKDFSYISTGGGAFLEWLEGKTLPGIAILYQS